MGAAVRRAAEISNQPFSALEGRQHLLDFFRSQNVHVVPAPGRGGVYHVWAPDPHNPDGLRFRGEVGNFPSFPWGGDLAAIQRQLQVIADAVKNTINDDAPLETSTHRKAEFNVTIDCAGQPDCAARAYAAVANGGMNGNAAFTMEPQDGGLRYRTQPHAGTMVGDVGNHESTRLTLVEGGIDAIVYGKAGDASIVPIRDKNAPKPESE
ncbi:MAG: hypothetical protein HY059_22745 [Proteobacteria bacterium]|nr:hypothetical protein [Pseudomonadota bacterium]